MNQELRHIIRCLACVGLALGGSSLVAGESLPSLLELPEMLPFAGNRFVDFFRPFRTEWAAISPDGRRLAYSFREGSWLSVVALEVDRPEVVTTRVVVGSDATSSPMMSSLYNEDLPARIDWMRWVTPTRLVLETNRVYATIPGRAKSGAWVSFAGTIMAFDADGGHAGTLVSATTVNAFRPSAPKVGELFPGEEGALTFRTAGLWYKLDGVTGRFTEINEDLIKQQRAAHPNWRREAQLEEKAVLRELGDLLPGRTLTVQEADVGAQRFLVLARGPADAGAFYVFDRPTRKLFEFARRAPWLDDTHAHKAVDFAIESPSRPALAGILTLPNRARVKTPPLVIFFSGTPWAKLRAEFQPEVQALVEMGFAVAQFQPPGDANTPAGGRAFGASLTTAVADLAARYQVNATHVALVGDQRGGLLAARTLWTQSERFRAAVLIDPAVEDYAEFSGRPTYSPSGADSASASTAPASSDNQPLLALSYHGRDGGPARKSYVATRYLAERWEKWGRPAEFGPLSYDFTAGLPRARAATWQQIERFLNHALYDFGVQIGELKTKPN